MALDIILKNEWPILLYFQQSPSSPGSVSPNGSTGNQQPLMFQTMFHSTKVLFFIQWCSPVFHESSLPFLSNIAIWIKNFRGIHSCCDLEHMFQIMISFTFWFLSNDYFTLWPFGCSQDAQSLRICEAGHQIHQTSSSLPCDFITASRAGQKALFRITVIKSYWFEQSISNSEHTEAQFISENIEHGIKAPSQGLDQP